MTDEEKLQKLIEMENMELIEEDHALIRLLISDPDSLIRSQSTALLIMLPDEEEAVRLLLRQCDDSDWLVRTEAYDALSQTRSNEAEQRLLQAIKTEEEEIARSYAILSWADIHADYRIDSDECIGFILSWMKKEESEHCRLSCAYALYRFEYKGALEMLLSYLDSEDYSIRCAVVNRLTDAARFIDFPLIRAKLEVVYQTETSRAVTSTIEKFLRKYNLRPME